MNSCSADKYKRPVNSTKKPISEEPLLKVFEVLCIAGIVLSVGLYCYQVYNLFSIGMYLGDFANSSMFVVPMGLATVGMVAQVIFGLAIRRISQIARGCVRCCK